MKKLFCILVCVLLLASCSQDPAPTSSDMSSQDISSIIVSEDTSSEEVSEITSSQEEVFEFFIDAKTAVKKIQEDIPFTADVVELDSHFIYEKTGVSSDMYLDFYGEASYETADSSFIAVFCCGTNTKVDKLKQKLGEALADEEKISYLSPYAKVLSVDGYVVLIATQNNFDEENLVSKLIQ